VNRLLIFIFSLYSLSAAAQPQIVNFRELQQFLPQANFQDYIRGKTDGETSTMMGFTTSWASVIYSSHPDSNKAMISIKITDMLNIPSYMSIPPSSSTSPNQATGTGYRKTVSYGGLSVIETYDSTLHQAKLQLTVATRFLVEINGDSVADSSVLYSFLGKTDIDGLRKIAAGGAGGQK